MKIKRNNISKYLIMTSPNAILLNLHFLCFIILNMNSTALGYPLDKLTVDLPDPELKDETRYENGTVVGKYTYTDDEGNPIHVKYFADDAGYGVELKSIRVMDSTSEEPSWQSNNFDTLKSIEPHLEITSGLLSNSDKKKLDFKNKHTKINPYSKNAKSFDYETFYQNEIKAPRKCEKAKVKVYLDKEKRIIRRALDNYQVAKHCERL